MSGGSDAEMVLQMGLAAVRKLQEEYSVEYLQHLIRDLPEDTMVTPGLAYLYVAVLGPQAKSAEEAVTYLNTLLLFMFARGLDVGRRKATLVDKRWVVAEE